MKKRVCIIDYGVGNISTLVTLLEKAGVQFLVSSDPHEIRDSEILVLAGVGSFDYGMSRLNELGITTVVREAVSDGNQKIIGICLGMQLLFEGSSEGVLPGIGVLSGISLKFPSEILGEKLRVPHMGWSLVKQSNHETSISSKYDSHRFYFVHSYYVHPSNPEIVKFNANYGIEFPALIESDTVLGAQFHPEKSSRQGRSLFLEMLDS